MSGLTRICVSGPVHRASRIGSRTDDEGPNGPPTSPPPRSIRRWALVAWLSVGVTAVPSHGQSRAERDAAGAEADAQLGRLLAPRPQSGDPLLDPLRRRLRDIAARPHARRVAGPALQRAARAIDEVAARRAAGRGRAAIESARALAEAWLSLCAHRLAEHETRAAIRQAERRVQRARSAVARVREALRRARGRQRAVEAGPGSTEEAPR